MKKTLLLATFISGCFFTNAQILVSEDFSGLTVGNIGTDITGTTAGQGGYFTSSTLGSNTDYQIVDAGGTYGNALQLTGSPSDTGTKLLWKDGLSAAWSTRTVGNDVIEVEYDFYTGGTTTSKSTTGPRLFNAAGQTIAGFRFVPETKVITGLARYNNAGTVGTYYFNLGAANAAITLTPNTWYRIGFAFDKTTGNITWKGANFYVGVPGTEMGVDPDELDFLVAAGTANTVAAVAQFDNYKITANLIEGLLLSVDSVFNEISNEIKMYPNPVNSNLFIKSNGITISNIEIIDINGRLVKTTSLLNSTDNKINVSDLSAGVYLINIYANDTKTTKKFIKN